MGDVFWKEFGRKIFPISQHSCIFGSKGASKTAPLNFFNECTALAIYKLRVYVMSVKLITLKDLSDSEAKFTEEEERRNPDNYKRKNVCKNLVDGDIESIVDAEMFELQQVVSSVPVFDVDKVKFVKLTICVYTYRGH